MTDLQQASKALEYGKQARRGGKRSGDNPYRGNTTHVRNLRAEWHRGWQLQDFEIKAQAGRK